TTASQLLPNVQASPLGEGSECAFPMLLQSLPSRRYLERNIVVDDGRAAAHLGGLFQDKFALVLENPSPTARSELVAGIRPAIFVFESHLRDESAISQRL